MFRNECLEFTVCEFGSLGPGFRAFSDRVQSCGQGGGMLRALHALASCVTLNHVTPTIATKILHDLRIYSTTIIPRYEVPRVMQDFWCYPAYEALF